MNRLTILRVTVCIHALSIVFSGSLRAQSTAPSAARPATASVQGVAGGEITLPAVPNFTIRQPFYARFAEDALAICRGLYSAGAGFEVDFAARLFASSERATRSLNKSVDNHLKNGGRIVAREFGRSSGGEHIEVVRCTRSGIQWVHWVIGDKEFTAATRENKDLQTFLTACPAWDSSPRVQWHAEPTAAFQQAIAARLPMVFYFFGHGEYSDNHERNTLASPEFNAHRERAVFLALDPTADDAVGNAQRKMKELNVTIFPTTSVLEVKTDGMREMIQIAGYHTPREFHALFRSGLDQAGAAATAPAPATASLARKTAPAAPVPPGAK